MKMENIESDDDVPLYVKARRPSPVSSRSHKETCASETAEEKGVGVAPKAAPKAAVGDESSDDFQEESAARRRKRPPPKALGVKGTGVKVSPAKKKPKPVEQRLKKKLAPSDRERKPIAGGDATKLPAAPPGKILGQVAGRQLVPGDEGAASDDVSEESANVQRKASRCSDGEGGSARVAPSDGFQQAARRMEDTAEVSRDPQLQLPEKTKKTAPQTSDRERKPISRGKAPKPPAASPGKSLGLVVERQPASGDEASGSDDDFEEVVNLQRKAARGSDGEVGSAVAGRSHTSQPATQRVEVTAETSCDPQPQLTKKKKKPVPERKPVSVGNAPKPPGASPGKSKGQVARRQRSSGDEGAGSDDDFEESSERRVPPVKTRKVQVRPRTLALMLEKKYSPPAG
jgi:hypothetical protein